jgi:Kef-type K+ transport system membrane component KefB
MALAACVLELVLMKYLPAKIIDPHPPLVSEVIFGLRMGMGAVVYYLAGSGSGPVWAYIVSMLVMLIIVLPLLRKVLTPSQLKWLAMEPRQKQT